MYLSTYELWFIIGAMGLGVGVALIWLYWYLGEGV